MNRHLSLILIAALLATPAGANVFDDIGDAIGRGAKDVGRAIEGGAKDTGRAIEGGAKGTGRAIERGANDTGRAISGGGAKAAGQAGTRILRSIDIAFCQLSRRSSEPPCTGRTGAGSFTDERGQQAYFTYDPERPDIRRPVTPERLTLPDGPAATDATFGQPMFMAPWEQEASDRMHLFIRPDDRLGLPWPGMATEIRSPTGSWATRPGGGFLSNRAEANSRDARRLWMGMDLLNRAGDRVQAPADGMLTRADPPDGRFPEFRALQITTATGHRFRIFPVAATPQIEAALRDNDRGIVVRAGETIGTAQDTHMPVIRDGTLVQPYLSQAPQFLHVQVRDRDGRPVDPKGRLFIFARGER
ncbi:MAG TPA: hypothetical protein VGC80_17105 [Acetobacteraceae bacterium]